MGMEEEGIAVGRIVLRRWRGQGLSAVAWVEGLVSPPACQLGGDPHSKDAALPRGHQALPSSCLRGLELSRTPPPTHPPQEAQQVPC